MALMEKIPLEESTDPNITYRCFPRRLTSYLATNTSCLATEAPRMHSELKKNPPNFQGLAIDSSLDISKH